MRSGVIEAASAAQVEAQLSAQALEPVAIVPLPDSAEAAAASTRAARLKAAGVLRRPGAGAGAAAGAAAVAAAGAAQAGFSGLAAGAASASARAAPGAIDTADLLDLAKQMNILMRAGVAPSRAFTGLTANIRNPALTAVVEEMATAVQQSEPLWRAMAAQPAVFDEFSVAVVRQGEPAGKLAEAFKTIYLHHEFQDFMRTQALASQRLPLMLGAALAVSGVLGLGGLLPWAVQMLPASPQPLPGLTLALLHMGGAIQEQGPLAVLGAGALLLALRSRPRWAPAGLHQLRDRLRLMEPLSGPTLRANALARLAGNLALAQRSGLPLPRSLQLAALECGNAHLAAVVEQARRLVEQGEPLSTVFRHACIFNAEAQQTLEQGEAQDSLHEALVDITQIYRAESEAQQRTMLHRFDVLMVLGLALLAVLLVAALVVPVLGSGAPAGLTISSLGLVETRAPGLEGLSPNGLR
ncbi:MAG: type II secretion system F family protein [Rubrivivax sp.]|nr:type II secretion system F family protein [Rubrivivax sp.]